MIVAGSGLLWAMLACSAARAAEGFDELYARLRASAPEGMPLAIRLPKGAGPYAPGEPIAIELEFGAATGFDTRIDEPTRPSDSRWDWVEVAGPAGGWIDPFDAEFSYFGNGPGCGNISTSRAPRTSKTFLNEWVRFLEPGRYRLYFRSARTWGSREAVSNVVQVDIAAAPGAAQAARWADLIRRWNDPATRKEAARDISYLGTLSAARFLARRLGDAEAGRLIAFLALTPRELLAVLEETPPEARRSETYVSLRAFAWMRRLQPWALRYGPRTTIDRKSWRGYVDAKLFGIYSSAYEMALKLARGGDAP